ncbi:hypothetical protein BGZ98_008809 [Dissophora globulifera]|nr:hypothetical protein BGZ98_008809 [Dissophora globulifera]
MDKDIRKVDPQVPNIFVSHTDMAVLLGRGQSKSESSSTLSGSNLPDRHPAGVGKTDSPLSDVLSDNLKASSAKIVMPKIHGRFETTSQLAFCIGLLHLGQPSSSTDEDGSITAHGTLKDLTDTTYRSWIETIEEYPGEKERILWLGSRLAMQLAKDKVKEANSLAEVLFLGPVLEDNDYKNLLSSIVDKIKVTTLASALIPLVQGLVQLLQSAAPSCHDAADLVAILRVLKEKLYGVHKPSSKVPYHLILAVSRVLQVMVDQELKDLDRVLVHESLSEILSGFKDSTDPYVIYQASYALQALQYVPDNESVLHAFLRHSGGLVEGFIKVSGVVRLDLSDLLKGLNDIQRTANDIYKIGKSTYEGMRTLVESGRGVFNSIKEGAGMSRKRPWYVAIRGAETLAQEGRFADLNQLICDAACRKDSRFQWGICQLLGEIAVGLDWDISVRQRTIDLLGKLYRNSDWERDTSVKQWMLTILNQITETADQTVKDHANTLLKELKPDGYLETGIKYPIESRLPPPEHYPLLSQIQGIPYVEYDLRHLRSERLQLHDQTVAVYIPPQAKTSLRASDDDHFPLMEEVEKFLKSKREVLLILGDNGAGKSTFSNKLAYNLWKDYRNKGPIPLHIQLLGIDRPDHDMIRKQLTNHSFSPDHIKELKLHREFIMICDGYDESQLKSNLYDTNLFNQPGQWQGKLIICCRSQYLLHDYRDRFRPHPTRTGLSSRTALEYFQELVIVPFTQDQIESYVDQYVKLSLSDRPEWTATDYIEKLRGIPNLIDLVKNPYLLTISLEVLPDIIGTEEDLSSISVTATDLYDISMAKWMRRSKINLQKQELLLPPAEQAALNRLLNDNICFEQHGIRYMKSLSTAVMEKHAGVPKIEYSSYADQNTWKSEFFGDKAETSLLRRASPLTGSGLEYRFPHRSLLEYFYSLDFYDPKEPLEADMNRFSSYLDIKEALISHPLRTKNIIDNPLVVQFLAERAQTNLSLRQQLLAMVESLETDAQSEFLSVPLGCIFDQSKKFKESEDEWTNEISDVDMSVKIKKLCYHIFDLSFAIFGMESMIYPVSIPLAFSIRGRKHYYIPEIKSGRLSLTGNLSSFPRQQQKLLQ